MNEIILYCDDFDYDVWEEYCGIAGVPYSAISIKIRFKPEDVSYEEYDNYEDEEDDNYEDEGDD